MSKRKSAMWTPALDSAHGHLRKRPHCETVYPPYIATSKDTISKRKAADRAARSVVKVTHAGVKAALAAEKAALVAENAALVAENTALVAENAALVVEKAALLAENTELVAENAELTEGYSRVKVHDAVSRAERSPLAVWINDTSVFQKGPIFRMLFIEFQRCYRTWACSNRPFPGALVPRTYETVFERNKLEIVNETGPGGGVDRVIVGLQLISTDADSAYPL